MGERAADIVTSQFNINRQEAIGVLPAGMEV